MVNGGWVEGIETDIVNSLQKCCNRPNLVQCGAHSSSCSQGWHCRHVLCLTVSLEELVPMASYPTTGHHWEESVSIFSPSSDIYM